MILAVAGKSADEVAAETKRLAGGGAGLNAVEKAAFAFVRKQAVEPWAVTDAEVSDLEKAVGKDRAWQVIWWALGVLVIWWLAYKMELSTAPQQAVEPESDVLAEPGPAPTAPRWIRNLLRRVT